MLGRPFLLNFPYIVIGLPDKLILGDCLCQEYSKSMTKLVFFFSIEGIYCSELNLVSVHKCFCFILFASI